MLYLFHDYFTFSPKFFSIFYFRFGIFTIFALSMTNKDKKKIENQPKNHGKMKYNVYYTTDGNEFHFVGEFAKKEDAIKCAKNQTSKCAVTEHHSFCDSPIIFKNY